MTYNVMQVEGLRQLSLTILREGVANAGVNDPLKTLTIPAHRFAKLDPAAAPFVHVVAKSDGGEGDGHELPYINSRATLHFNLLCACGRDDAKDLDAQAWTLAEAISLQILEDQRFLAAIQWVESFRPESDDGVARGDRGGEYDVVLIQIEIVVRLAPVRFEPRPPADQATLEVASIRPQLGPADQSIPAQSLIVRADIPTDP